MSAPPRSGQSRLADLEQPCKTHHSWKDTPGAGASRCRSSSTWRYMCVCGARANGTVSPSALLITTSRNRFVPSEVLFDVLHKAILSTIRCRAYRIVKPQIVSEQIALAAVTPRRPYGTIPEEHIISAIKKNDVQHQAGADPIPRQTFIAQYPKSLAVETRHAMH